MAKGQSIPGDSSFFNRVLFLTSKIPRGKVSTYKLIAKAMHSSAYRAVGSALNRNNTPILIPCHRIVNSDGRVGGYSSGKQRKVQLLTKEGIPIRGKRIIDLNRYLFRF